MVAKRIMLALPQWDWRRPPGRPRITWLSTIQHDLRCQHLTLPEAVDVAQNRPLYVEVAVDARRYVILELHARNDEDDDWRKCSNGICKKKKKNVRLDQVRCAGAHPHS